MTSQNRWVHSKRSAPFRALFALSAVLATQACGGDEPSSPSMPTDTMLAGPAGGTPPLATQPSTMTPAQPTMVGSGMPTTTTMGPTAAMPTGGGLGTGPGSAPIMIPTGSPSATPMGTNPTTMTPSDGGTAGMTLPETPTGEAGGCCSDGDCICRGEDPSAATLKANGPFSTESYSDFPVEGFGGGTIYYPTDAEPPYAFITMCPGFTAVQSSIAAWGPFLASHGIVVMTIDTFTTGDQVDTRDDQLLAAIEVLKQENDRMGSPLNGKLSKNRYGVSGWSMGGGGTWLAAKATNDLKSAMTLAGHHVTAGGAQTVASGITVPTIMFAGATDPDILGGGKQSQQAYDAIPETTPKILYEMAAEGHFSWGTPTTNSGELGAYGLAFQKTFLEGDERYRQFLLTEGPGASEWRSNVK